MTNLCTSGQAIIKAGVGVSDISGSAYIDTWISGASAKISTIARYDYVTNYSTLSTVGKNFLRDLCSDMVAIKIISYDMGGYTSRVEAEDMVNILRDNKLTGFGLLRDEKHRKFIKDGT